ncbi:MAG: hypothetical protein M3P11_03615 [Actinomycetota bacterium]|nr:hypothetical protein [Actinomycetota bacterium]
MAAGPERSRPEPAATAESLRLVVPTALAIILFYVVLFPARGMRIPAWSDAQTYIWWVRRAGALGLSAFGTGSRPGTIALLSSLATLLHLPVEAVVEVIGPVLAASVGLATAAWTESSLGANRRRFVLTAVLTATFLCLLVTSFYCTLAFIAVFVTGLVCVSEGLGSTRRPPVVAGGVLAGAAALAHPIFASFGALVLLGGLAAMAWAKRSARDQGQPEAFDGRWLIAGTIGVTIISLGLLVARSAAGPPIDTSADGLFRRLDLPSLFYRQFRDTLSYYLPALWPSLAAAALALIAIRRWPTATPLARRALFWGSVSVWLALTVSAVVLLIVGLSVPGQRLAVMCLPLPILMALGASTTGPARRRATAAALPILLAGLVVLVPWYWRSWATQKPNSAEAVAGAKAVGEVLARQPAGTTLIAVVDERSISLSFQVTRDASYLRDAVPPARVPDVFVFVGTVSDFLAGRPTITGNTEHDRVAVDSWDRIRTRLDRPALAVVFSSFDPRGYRDAMAMAGSRQLAPGVVVLPGFVGGVGVGAPSGAALTSVGAGPLSPWLPVWLAPLVLAVLAVAGWPWARLSLKSASATLRAALLPAFGIASISLTAIALDAFGFRLSGWAGHAPFVLATACGFLALRIRGTPGINRRPLLPVRPPAPQAEARRGSSVESRSTSTRAEP